MNGLALLLGHLVGDYIFQNDYLASNKANPHPGPEPGPRTRVTFDDDGSPRQHDDPPCPADVVAWHVAASAWWTGHLACTVHCLMYTLAVWALSWWWMPLWGLAACFLLHWPIDRFRLARAWMDNVSGQAAFASGPLAPWSVVVVDNIAHLLVLLGIAWLAGVPF